VQRASARRILLEEERQKTLRTAAAQLGKLTGAPPGGDAFQRE